MEMSKQPYPETLNMPVNRFTNYLKWKMKLEEDKAKALDQKMAQGL